MQGAPEIREAQADDAVAIRDLTVTAFSESEFGHNGEAGLIDTLVQSASNYLSLVATLDDQVVGHILFTPVVIRADGEEQKGMGLAPMSVSPAHQRRGIGSTLVRAGLGTLFDAGCCFAVVLGHPAYYPRFGFEPASAFGVRHRFEGIPQDVFFLARHPRLIEPIQPGDLFFDAAFGQQHALRE